MVNKILDLCVVVDTFYSASMVKNSFIKKLPNGKWRVVSEKGKNLGTFDSKEDATKRLQQVEFFKHKKAIKEDSSVIDLSNLTDLTYSAIMRELRKTGNYEVVKNFLTIYKQIFDVLINFEITDAADKALPVTIMIFSKLFPVKLSGSKND